MRVLLLSVFSFSFLQTLDCLTNKKPDNSRLNYFDTDLLKYATEDRRGNVVVSPASIKSTLAMLLEGSSGSTETEIRSSLRLSPNKNEYREQLNAYLSALQLNATGGQLQSANGVFVSNKLSLRKEYELTLRKVYLTEVVKMDFRDPGAATAIINNWINNKTSGLIPILVEPAHVSPTSEILLSNALYFKSTWRHSFDRSLSHPGCFRLRGRCKNVVMMESHAEMNYAFVDNLRAHAVELPYASNRYSMILLVPQEPEGLSALIRDLPYMSLPQISGLLEPSDVQLSMPKFTVDYSEDMVGALRSMRITTVFSSQSNLSGILEGGNAQINHLFHKVHISVDEDGTVAAAASAAMVIPLIEGSVQLVVDRPFVFFIRDNDLGIVVFEGKIEDPSDPVIAVAIEKHQLRNHVKGRRIGSRAYL